MLDASSQAGSSRSEPLLSAISISKRYGDFYANDSIDLDLYPAEIHALLGENGAGKSTLVKVMYGLIQPTSGELRWMGQKVVLSGPSEARTLGVGMVFQHFSLFENLTVAENVALGLPPTESFSAMSARLEETARVYGLPLDPKREGRGDGDAALLLLLHPIHGRGAFVHLAHLMALAGVIEDALGRGRLAGINVGHDAEVAVILDPMGAGHGEILRCRRLYQR